MSGLNSFQHKQGSSQTRLHCLFGNSIFKLQNSLEKSILEDFYEQKFKKFDLNFRRNKGCVDLLEFFFNKREFQP